MSKKSKKSLSPANQTSTPAPAPAAPQEAEYQLTEARQTALAQEAAALGNDLLVFPGRLDRRVRWSTTIRLAAVRDAADLVLAPFHDDPMVTLDEISAQRDYIEYLRLCESRYQALRGGQQLAVTEFDTAAEEAGAHKELLLRAFDLRFATDPKGQKRLSAIRAGSGDADLVQDVSDLVVLADEQNAYLAKCPRGEAAAAARLKAMSPRLTELLGKKGMTEDAVKARRLRDGAYTLVMRTERRLRAAADYWYRGTDKMKDYAPFTLPATSQDEKPEGDAEATTEPTVAATPEKAVAATGKQDKPGVVVMPQEPVAVVGKPDKSING